MVAALHRLLRSKGNEFMAVASERKGVLARHFFLVYGFLRFFLESKQPRTPVQSRDKGGFHSEDDRCDPRGDVKIQIRVSR